MTEKNSERAHNDESHGRQREANRPDAFNVLAWLTEGAAGIASELKNSDLGLGDEFWKHTYNARREGLLAARALLDQIIEHSEKEHAQKADREQRRERRGKIAIG